MITEDHVSFETAKLLKEKGFDESCWQKYDNEGCLSPNHVGYINSEKPCTDFCALAPTLQMAMKWLREVHNLWLEISPEGKGLWYMEVYSLTDEAYIPNSNGHKIKSYEEACEAAIKYCLENLVKITK